MSSFERHDIPVCRTFMHRSDVLSVGEEGLSEGTERYLDTIQRISTLECDPVLMHLKTVVGRALGSLGLQDDRFNTYGPIIESSAADVDDRMQNAALGILEKLAASGHSKGSIATYANRIMQENSRDEDILETNAPRIPQCQLDDIRKAHATFGSLAGEAQRLQEDPFKNAQQIWQLHQWEQRAEIERGAVFFDDIYSQTESTEASDEDYDGFDIAQPIGAERFNDDVYTDATAEISFMVAAVETFLAEGPLDQRQENIIRLRFGIGIDRALTLHEIGESLGIRSNRVRHMVERALQQLRWPGKDRVKVEGFAGLWSRHS